jgi:hypothetical protein
MLPFLDVLLSGIGVFLLITALQAQVGETAPPVFGADILAIIGTDGRVDWIPRDGEEITQTHVIGFTSILRTLATKIKRPVRIVAAFSAGGIKHVRDFQQELDHLARRNRTGETGSKEQPVSFSLTWLPLVSSPDAKKQLLEEWHRLPTSE